MLEKKRVIMGEYIIDIEYNEDSGSIDVSVLDELEGIIESISISNVIETTDDIENDDDDNSGIDIDISLN